LIEYPYGKTAGDLDLDARYIIRLLKAPLLALTPRQDYGGYRSLSIFYLHHVKLGTSGQ
jgi:hypothetical protein